MQLYRYTIPPVYRYTHTHKICDTFTPQINEAHKVT